MKTAKQMKKIQDDATRTWIEHEITFQAKGMTNVFICSSQQCPEWLREELNKKGYKVTVGNNETDFGVKIEW